MALAPYKTVEGEAVSRLFLKNAILLSKKLLFSCKSKKAILPPSATGKNIDVWFQDEARFGQQNSISRVWAPTGSRPGLIRQQQYEYAYVFGAVRPEQDKAIGLVLASANAKGLASHLQEISQATEQGHHAVVILDRAFESYEDIVNTCCDAWNKLRNEAGRLRSLCSRKWAIVP